MYIKSAFIKYLLFCVAFILVTEITKICLHFDNLVYNSLSEQLTENQVKKILNLQEKWKWIGYVFVPVFILLKTIIISSVIYIGVFFFSKHDVAFKRIWNSVIKVEFVFLLVPILKTVWFYFFQTHYTLEDVQFFYPLSALNITGYKGLEPWLLYPLQVLNLFEVAYIILLSHQIGKLTQTNADTGLKIVSYSYIPALLLWVVVVMFFTLNYS